MRLLASKSQPMSIWHQGLVLLFVLTGLWTCTSYARIPKSVASIGLGILWLVRVSPEVFPLQLWKGAPQAAWSYFKRLDYSAAALLPMGYALALCWTSDFDATATFMRIALPCMGISGTFYVFRDVIGEYKLELISALVFFSAVATVGVASYAITNSEALIVALGKGRAMPTPISHVRYATALAFSAIGGMYLFTILPLGKLWRWSSLLAALLLVFTLHLIAVRTGLVLFYLGGLVLLVRVVMTRIQSKLVAGLALVSLLAVVGLVSQIPTVARKIEYTKWELQEAGKAEAANYSDAARMASASAGWQLIKSSPWLGVVEGGFRQNMSQVYKELGYSEVGHLPTNQFLFSWALAGVLGLLAVVGFVLGPLLEKHWWKRPLLLEFVLMIAALFMVETPLSSDLGVAMSVYALYLAKAGQVEE